MDITHISRDWINNFLISTIRYNNIYETAILHRSIQHGDTEYIVVERYDREEDAKKGHKRWINYCGTQPTQLINICGETYTI